MKRFRATLAVVGVVSLVGCDIPTEPPIIDQRWILPVENTAISVDELLPSGVTVNGTNFEVTVDPFSTSESLATLCPNCVSSGGVPVPKPVFNESFSVTQALPADVAGADLTSGSIALQIQNGFAFDPVRPGGATGDVTITITDGQGGTQLGQVVIDGASEALPPGGTVTKTLTLAPGAIGTTLYAVVTVNSPGGDPVAIDTNERITVQATPSSILVASALVNVAGRDVTFDQTDLDVEDIDTSISDRIQQGGIVLDIQNPFGVSVTATFDIDYGAGVLSRTLNIGSGTTSTVSLTYSGDDFRLFLGQPNVTLSGSGTVEAAAGSITVTPGQEVVIDAEIDLTLRIGN